MKKVFSGIFVLCLFITGCSPDKTAAGRPLLAGNLLVESMVRDIWPAADVVSLVPPGACPGHYDMKPSDAEAISRAGLFIYQPFQEAFYEKAVKINPAIQKAVIKEGGLTTPRGYIMGLDETAKILSGFFPDKEGLFEGNRRRVSGTITEAEEKWAGHTGRIREKKFRVITTVFHEPLCEYLGFEVVGKFGSPDSLTVRDVRALKNAAEDKGVDFIVSNVTGNHGIAAAIIGKEIKKPVIAFASIPESGAGGSGFFKLWNYNMEELAKATGIRDDYGAE